MQPIVDKLSALIEKNGWKDKFEQTIAATQKQNISALASIHSLNDYLKYVDGFALRGLVKPSKCRYGVAELRSKVPYVLSVSLLLKESG